MRSSVSTPPDVTGDRCTADSATETASVGSIVVGTVGQVTHDRTNASDPSPVALVDAPVDGDMDTWLATLDRRERTDLGVTAATLVDEGRSPD
jgi:hypothetical protein